MYPRRFSRIIAEKAVEKVEQSQHRNLILIIGLLGFGLFMLVVAMMNIFSEATPDPTTRWIGVVICILLSFLFHLRQGLSASSERNLQPADTLVLSRKFRTP